MSILGSGSVVGIITFLFTRNKSTQEVRKLKAEAQNAELDSYRKMREIIQTELQPYIDRIQQLEQKIFILTPLKCSKNNCPNRE